MTTIFISLPTATRSSRKLTEVQKEVNELWRETQQMQQQLQREQDKHQLVHWLRNRRPATAERPFGPSHGLGEHIKIKFLAWQQKGLPMKGRRSGEESGPYYQQSCQASWPSLLIRVMRYEEAAPSEFSKSELQQQWTERRHAMATPCISSHCEHWA